MKTRSDFYSNFKQVQVGGDPQDAGNGLTLTPAAASATPSVAAVGDDANVELELAAKGAAKVYVKQDSGVYRSPVLAAEVTFTETAGAGTYTGSVVLPAGATLHDIVVNGVALWDNAGAVTLKVGDATDDDGYYTAVNLKATDLLAGESISFALAGGKAGAYIANSQVSPRYAAAARTISGIITTAGAAGSTGRTRMTVLYSTPSTVAISAATKA